MQLNSLTKSPRSESREQENSLCSMHVPLVQYNLILGRKPPSLTPTRNIRTGTGVSTAHPLYTLIILDIAERCS